MAMSAILRPLCSSVHVFHVAYAAAGSRIAREHRPLIVTPDTVPQNLTPGSKLSGILELLYPGDVGSRFLSYLGKTISDYTMSRPRRL
jgi:hypothetical protein